MSVDRELFVFWEVFVEADGTQGRRMKIRRSRADLPVKWLKMVFIPVFELRRCFGLFCMRTCFSSREMTLIVQKVKQPVNRLRNLKKRVLASDYMFVKTYDG